MTKLCIRCNQVRPADDFWPCKKNRDGLFSYCRTCGAQYSLDHYYKNHDKHRAERVEWREKNRDKVRRASRAYYYRIRKGDPKMRAKESARLLTHHAIRAGKLVKQPCSVCGAPAEAHHPDYSKPLDVVWLCAHDHKEEHKRLRRAAKKAA